MALVDYVDRLVPPWAKGTATAHWWNLFRLVAVMCDGILEGVYQGRLAGLPNAVDLPGSRRTAGSRTSSRSPNTSRPTPA